MSARAEHISIRVKPRSSRSGVTLGQDGLLVVSVHAPATEGAANREMIEVLAAALGVSRSAVSIVRGQRSRSKLVAVADLTAAEAYARLAGPGSRTARRPGTGRAG
jgi:uncharacterized protein (TIGR00251 family)